MTNFFAFAFVGLGAFAVGYGARILHARWLFRRWRRRVNEAAPRRRIMSNIELDALLGQRVDKEANPAVKKPNG